MRPHDRNSLAPGTAGADQSADRRRSAHRVRHRNDGHHHQCLHDAVLSERYNADHGRGENRDPEIAADFLLEVAAGPRSLGDDPEFAPPNKYGKPVRNRWCGVMPCSNDADIESAGRTLVRLNWSNGIS